MKRLFLILFMAVSLPTCLSINAQGVIIPLSCEIFDPSSLGNQPSRGPIDPPTVYLENYTLTFATSHPEYVLYIKDENETVAYSTVVTSATKEVVLPSTLSGDYEIQLVTGNWCFWGYITL